MVPARPAPAPPAAGPPWAVLGLVAVAAAFSLAVGYYQLLGWHELHAVLEYDDGVWFGSAVRLAHGVLPYRSFVMDQPPGVPLLMAPVGLLSDVIGTRSAFGLARLTLPLVGSVTVVAAGWLVRHRGYLAVAVSAGVAAVYPEALIDQRTVMLEPFSAMLCLLGLVGAFSGDSLSDRPRRLALAGVAFGLAGSCKAFALLPFTVVLAALLVSPGRRRRVGALLAGAAVAVVGACGPFFVLAPTQFVHQVVATQITRSQKSEPAIWDRVFSLVGLLPATGRAHGYPDDSHAAVAAVLALFVALVLLGWIVRARAGSRPGRRHLSRPGASGRARPRPSGPAGRAAPGWPGAALVSPLDLVAVGAVLLTGLALVQPPAYYGHYAAFLAPFLAVALGLTAGSLALRLPAVIAVVATAALVAGSIHAVHVVEAQRTGPFEAARLDALIPAGSCVVSDNAPVLILADRFTSSRPECPALVDAYGTTLSAGHGDPPDSPRADRNGAVAAWREIFAHAGYIVLTSGFGRERIPWTGPLRSYVQAEFRTLQATSPMVLIRRFAPSR